MTVICSECEDVFDDSDLETDDNGEYINICPCCGQEAFFNSCLSDEDLPRYDDSIDYDELEDEEEEGED